MSAEQPFLDLGPEVGRYVGPGGGAALLTLVLVGPANEADAQRIDIGAGVSQNEILTAGFPHDSGIGRVLRQVSGDGLPQRLKDLGRTGEMDSREGTVRE